MPDDSQPTDPTSELPAEDSGSRWEGDDSDTPAEPVTASVNPDAGVAPDAAGAGSRSGWTQRLGGSGSRPAWARPLGLAAAALGLVAAGAAGGFALGHATSDDGRGFRETSFHGGRDGDQQRPGPRGDHQRPGPGDGDRNSGGTTDNGTGT